MLYSPHLLKSKFISCLSCFFFLTINSAAETQLALEEVFVTAEKRTENVQAIPAAITTFSAEMIHDMGISELAVIEGLTPGLGFSSFSLGQPQLYIRGIGSNEDSAGGDASVVIYLDGLVRALGILAPEGDWAWLQGVAKRCRAEARTRKPKAARLRESRELFELGLQLMDDAGVASPLAWKQAVRFRDGLMIALLAARPLRLANFAGLQIDRHLVRAGGDFWLMLSPDETKTHVHIELPIPRVLNPYLERYLEEHRRTLSVGRTSPFLWLTHDARPLRPPAVYKAIVKRTRKAFGRSVNPHLFRDCAATSLAIEDPEHVRAASALLGHTSLASTTKYYNQATTLSASRQHTRAVMALRRSRGSRRSAEWRPL